MPFTTARSYSTQIIVPPHCTLIHPHLSCDAAFAGDLRVLAHIGRDSFFLLIGAAGDGGQVAALLDGFDFRFHLLNQVRQESFTLFPRLGVHIPGVLLPIRPHGGIAAFPEVFADLADTAGAGLAFLAYVWLEVVMVRFSCGSAGSSCGAAFPMP